ncbi:hypothetical protein C0Q70_12051 [Pomacea canaliculata]|uniref:Uncharacterized protein n=1 Tax=Pomacea canaliculata TaxID=400727 RepID=A0A2T7P0G5_POMCA|nr:hypothetical protein C0Q70_12051 [Pomacea canaliculata]
MSELEREGTVLECLRPSLYVVIATCTFTAVTAVVIAIIVITLPFTATTSTERLGDNLQTATRESEYGLVLRRERSGSWLGFVCVIELP